MADRPILFSGPMVRAILDGKKTQTRRVLLNRGQAPDFRGPSGCQDDRDCWGWENGDTGEHIGVAPASDGSFRDHYSGLYAVGDTLYVREAHALVPASAYRQSEGVEQRLDPADPDRAVVYREGWGRSKPNRWRPSIHMPRWASRISLAVTDVRVQRLQEMGWSDAVAEGIHDPRRAALRTDPVSGPVFGFHALWDSLNASRGYGWNANPWVVAITFVPSKAGACDGP